MSHVGTESKRLASANIQSELAIVEANAVSVFSPRRDLDQLRFRRVLSWCNRTEPIAHVDCHVSGLIWSEIKTLNMRTKQSCGELCVLRRDFAAVGSTCRHEDCPDHEFLRGVRSREL
jgi:hypothetical protein